MNMPLDLLGVELEVLFPSDSLYYIEHYKKPTPPKVNHPEKSKWKIREN